MGKLLEDYMADLLVTSLVEEAMELLNDGFPLDDEIKKKLKEVKIDPIRFTELHENKVWENN